MVTMRRAKREFLILPVAKSNNFVSVSGDLSSESERAQPENMPRRTRMARGAPRGFRNLPRAHKLVLWLSWLGLFFMAVYTVTVGVALLQPGYRLVDRIGSFFLIFAFGFIVIHGIGYTNSMLKAMWGYRETRSRMFAELGTPRVACIVACFNEPPEVLAETVGALMALNYTNKEVVILDDSTKAESQQGARKIARRYGIECIQRTNRRGYKAGAINDYLAQSDAEFLAIFDADALPVANFLSDVVPQIQENPKLAFVQTPQFYANTDVSYVALAAARQQNVFYEYICEGKSVSRAAFCCGTNVIFRRAALEDVGGFDEKSVTEDFATSFDMHLKGWDSLYLNRVFVYLLAPENLAAYFTQQSRWSFGTLGTARHIFAEFFKHPRSLRLGQWWEYFLSATYYWVGWVNFIFMCLPIAYIFFGIKPLQQDTFTYIAVFIPYFLFSLNMFYVGMEARGFPLNQMVLGQQIGFISFPVHMSSAISSLLGRKRPFGVTPKGVGGRVAWSALWFQIAMLLLSLAAFVWGIWSWIGGYQRDGVAVLLNAFWALYHVWMLSSIFTLNKPVRAGAINKAFFDDSRGEPSPLPLEPLRGVRNPITPSRVIGVLTLLMLAGVGVIGWSALSWLNAPEYPVNVSILDRTFGKNGGEHRALSWTLNFLKVRHQPNFGPSAGQSQHTQYDAAQDYYGFVPDPKRLAIDPTKAADYLASGRDRPLPTTIETPGALYLADTYGEFTQYEARADKYVRFRAPRRGLSAEEIHSIDGFARAGGLVIGEWNTLGYPTRPGNFIAPAQLEAATQTQRERVTNIERVRIPNARRALRKVETGDNFKAIRDARGHLEDERGALIDARAKLDGLKNSVFYNAVQYRQAQAARQLEGILHVHYDGWYGRYVENFAEEERYDNALWKSVRAYVSAKAGRPTNPSGRGFVFYPDGPSEVFNPKTQALEPSPFGKPIAILEDELGNQLQAGLTSHVAILRHSTDPKVKNDALLNGVGDRIPGRYWFDVVTPQPGARVLSYYHLEIKAAAGQRLRKAGFPAKYLINGGTRVSLPAAVAWRDGDDSRGQLRSLYFAGNVANYLQVPELVQKYPVLGGVDQLISGRYGDYSSQFFWQYYQPIMRNVFAETPRIRYKSSGK